MKKSIIIIFMAIMTTNTFGQNKGEKYLSPSISASFGKQYATYIYNYYNNYSASQPMDITIGQSLEFGYFFVNNWRFAIALYIPFVATPKSQSDNKWKYENTLGVFFNPSFAYYVPLSDKFYYTPEIGYRFGFEFDFKGFDDVFDFGARDNYIAHSFYANLLGFEYRVSQKFAIAISVGSIYYTHAKIWGSSSYNYRVWQFAFNNGTVSAVFYL